MRRQQRRARGRAAPKRSAGPIILAVGAGALVVGLIVFLIYQAVVSTVGADTSAPKVGDHWHAPFKVVVCGERVGPLPPSAGDIHSHGDDVIHSHPSRPDTAGRNASISAFLAGAPLKVTQTALDVSGKVYKNGDKCPDGRPGTISVLVNGQPRDDFASYVPKDGDQLEFRFAP
ncbi:MAG: hypothetical protein ACT4P5_19540 [Armatimonadota bacterium]